jgi:hypothetical protein
MIPHVTAAEFVQGYQIRLSFSDGVTGIVDFKDRIVGRGGVFAELEDPVCFAKFSIDTEAGTLCWPNGVDFCPTMLHAIATGHGSVAA